MVFYVAKHFKNIELRAKGGEPHVANQIRSYSTILDENREMISTSYRKVFSNLLNLSGLSDRYPKREHMMRAVIEDRKPLEIDANPKLLIFGFDADQKIGKAWKPHKEKLTEIFGADRMISVGNSKGISL